MFNAKPTAEPRVTVLKECLPKVFISASALAKMQLYVDGCLDEIGWLGTAYRSGSVVTIEDVYLFDQEVHSTTTEITPEGLASFGEAILSDPVVDGMGIWNNLKMWGHSHVNMGVTPSGQDDAQMAFFSQSGHDWFLRLIANKKCEIRVDLYDYNAGIIYNDMAWEEAVLGEESDIYQQIDALYAQLDVMRDTRLFGYKVDIDAEIAHKVKKKVYQTYIPPTPTTGGTTNAPAIGTVKKNEDKNTLKNNGLLTWAGRNMDEFFDYCFNVNDLVDMKDFTDPEQLADFVYETVGYYLYEYQVKAIWVVVKKRLKLLKHLKEGEA